MIMGGQPTVLNDLQKKVRDTCHSMTTERWGSILHILLCSGRQSKQAVHKSGLIANIYRALAGFPAWG